MLQNGVWLEGIESGRAQLGGCRFPGGRRGRAGLLQDQAVAEGATPDESKTSVLLGFRPFLSLSPFSSLAVVLSVSVCL